MPDFTINLIRDSVMPPARRKTRYWCMVGYLAVSGLVLVITLWLATSWITQAAVVREDTVRLERAFLETHPNQDGIAAYAAWLERVAGERLGRLKAVDGLLAASARPAEAIYPLALSLPAGMSIRSLTVDAEQTVTFELLVVSSGTEADVDPSGLMARWSREAALGARLRGITYLGGTRQSTGERSDMVWRFSGRLARKDS